MITANAVPTQQTGSKQDMDKIDVRAALERRGWSLSRLSMSHGYTRCAAAMTFLKPWPQMEWIIAEAIDKLPWEIWPSRYPDGPVSRPERKSGCRESKQTNRNTGDAA